MNKTSKERFDWEGGTASEAEQPHRHLDPPDPHAGRVHVQLNGEREHIANGSVAIAAITSCTNTSNPSVMLGRRAARQERRRARPHVSPAVKTSLAPGSRAVIDYLENAGLMSYLEQLHFNLVGFGCTTCIGNSGPLDEPIAQAVEENDLVVAAVLSGNRNFEGRIHPQVRASYLASPPLVVAYALAGSVNKDLREEPLGTGSDGKPVFLREIWPSSAEIEQTVARSVEAGDVPARPTSTSSTATSAGGRSTCRPAALWEWDPESTYLREPHVRSRHPGRADPPRDITGRPRAGDGRRLRDDGPHLTGGRDQARLARRGST